MHADRNLRRCGGDRLVDRLYIKLDQSGWVVAVGSHPLADGRIAEHGERHFVELNIATAHRGKIGNLGTIDYGQVAEEIARAVIDAGISIATAAPEVHGRWRRQGHLGQRRSVIAKERELVERDRLAPRYLARHMRSGEGKLMAILVMEGETRRANIEAFDPLNEPAPIGATAKLAVGNDGKTNLLLKFDDVADRLVLSGGEALLVEFAVAEGTKGTAERGRAKQAADMVGTEGRAMHGALSKRHASSSRLRILDIMKNPGAKL